MLGAEVEAGSKTKCPRHPAAQALQNRTPGYNSSNTARCICTRVSLCVHTREGGSDREKHIIEESIVSVQNPDRGGVLLLGFFAALLVRPLQSPKTKRTGERPSSAVLCRTQAPGERDGRSAAAPQGVRDTRGAERTLRRAA